MADPRFTVYGNDIVFADTRTPISPGEFNKISTPEEKDLIDREFTARSMKTNQEGEGGSKDLAAYDEETNGLVDTPPSPIPTESTPAPALEPAPSLEGEDSLAPDKPVVDLSSEPAPTAGGEWKPPTLERFLEATRPENPQFDDIQLAKEYRKLYPEAATLYPAPKKDEWVAGMQTANPDYSPLQLKQYYDDIYGTPPPPKEEQGDFGRNIMNVIKQTPQLLYGLTAGAGAIGEKAFGPGGLATEVKKFGVEGYRRYSEDIAQNSKKTDSFIYSFNEARNGNPGALVDWMQAAAGYVGAQAIELVGFAEAGKIAGKLLLPDMAKLVAAERIAKEAAVIEQAATAAGKTLATEEIVAQATKKAAERIGEQIAIGATAFGMEGGEIFGDLVSKAEKEGRQLTGAELMKAGAMTGLAGLAEYAGDRVGADLLLGESHLGKAIAEATGLTGRASRAAATAGVYGAIEGGTEYGQTIAEEWGKGTAQVGVVTKGMHREAIDAAAIGAFGGNIIGGASGLLGGGPPPPAAGAPPASEPPEAPITPIMAQPDVDAAIKTAAAVADAPITAKQLDNFIAPNQTEIGRSVQQANLETIFSNFEPNEDDLKAGFVGFQRTPEGDATFNGVPLRVIPRDELPAVSAPESPVVSQEKYDVASLFAKAFDKELVIYQHAPGIPDGVVWRQLDPERIYLSSESTSADTFKVIGHELMHFMEGTELHEAFRQVVTENLTAEARTLAAKRHGALDERGLLNEIGADLAGSELGKREVWERVFKNLTERVGAEEAKTEVLSFIDALKDVISRIRNLIASRPWTAGSPEVQLANAYVTNLENIHDSLAAVVSDALAKEPSSTTSETTGGPQTTLEREIVHPEAVQAFSALAEQQRGEPELAMRDLKDFIGGGVLSPAIEHAGDLIHRVTEASRFGRANRPLVAAKVDALVQSLGHAYGFEKEHGENIAARAKALRLPISKVREQIATGLARYAAAQKALPVYNRVHWLMRETARAIGESRFADALATAKELQALTKSQRAFDRAAFAFTRGADQKIAQYREPLPVKAVANKAGELDEDTLYQLTKPVLGKKAGQTIRESVLKEAGYLPQPVDLARHGEAKTVEGVAKQSPQADLTEHPSERRTLSTTVPSGKKGDRDAYTQNWIIGTEDILASETHTKTLMNALREYPMMSKEKNPKKVFAEFKRKVVANLLWLHDLVPAEARERAKRWYDGANRIATEWAAQDGYTENQHAGVLAVLSPQKDWFMNVSLADRVRTIMKEQATKPWTREMTNWAEMFRVGARTPDVQAISDKFVEAAKRLEGKTLESLSNADAALFIRAYDQTYHERSYRLVTPEGGFGDYVTNKQETEFDLFGAVPKVKGTVAWGSQRFIEKAVSILRDGSNKNISEQLGSEHKVRNFYNNILHPGSEEGHVTIDTHAMGAALIKAVSGASLEVKHLFGAAGSNVWTGASGSYGLVADAYREAAKRRGILPREMQSITWEAVRGLFPWSVKKTLAPKIDAVWEDVRKGKITLVKAREKIFAMSGGINRFAWEEGGEGLSPANGGVSFEKGNPNVVSTEGRRFSRGGGVPGSQGVPSEPRRPYQGTGKAGRTLDGLPALVSVDGVEVEFAGFKPAQDAAAAYMEKAGLPYHPETVYHKIDKARAARIAAAYDAMPHTPQDPEVKAAYEAMVKETLAQYEAMLETGIVIEFNDGEDPYGNPRNAILDVIENNHMYVFSTREGFGSNVQFDPKDNPLLAETKFKFGDQPTLANDIFRAVHDYFGHVKDAVGFRAEGEDNAWYSHARMFSPLARRAMTTETRGQNSWVNYGPHGEFNRKANPADTIYADQKTGLLPEWVMEMDRPQASRANLVHYSKQAGLTTIDPAFHGSGQIGAERARMQNEGKGYLPRTYFYRAGTKIEPRFRGQTKYQVQVDEADLVDLAEFTGSPSERERAAKAAGYKGYYNSESSMPNVVAMFTPVNVGTSAQVSTVSVNELRSDPLFSPSTWVSQIEKVLEQKMPKSASAQQIKGILSPNNGVKQDELEAMGIDEYLASKEKFDKHNVLEWVKAHQIQAEKVELSGNQEEKKRAVEDKYFERISTIHSRMTELFVQLRQAYEAQDEILAQSVKNERNALADELLALEDAQTQEIDALPENGTKYEAWQLPGGKNYKEVFVTLPPKGDVTKQSGLSNWRVQRMYGEDFTAWEVRADRPDGSMYSSLIDIEEYPTEAEAILAARAIEERQSGDKEYREFLDTLDREYGPRWDEDVLTEDDRNQFYRLRDGDEGPRWKDGHDLYSAIENPIVRLRMNDRVTDDGKKVLFLEEVQPPNRTNQERMPKWALKRWREIGLKQALRIAAEGTYDAIGWTTGKQQADRYSVSQRIDRLKVDKRLTADGVSIGRYLVFVQLKGDTHWDTVVEVNENQLKDHIGEEFAAKVQADMAKNNSDSETYEGIDLEVGGEGLARIYDKDLINAANSMFKKWGTKVTSTTVPINRFSRYQYEGPAYTLDQLVKGHRVLHNARVGNVYRSPFTEHQHDFPLNTVMIEGALRDMIKVMQEGESFYTAITGYGTPTVANVLGGSMPRTQTPQLETVHMIPVTEAMKTVAKEGQPLFAPGAPRRQTPPPVQPTFTVEQPGWLDKVIRIFQDKNIDIKRVVESLQATGRQLPEDLNPVLKEEMYLKRAEQKSKDFTTDEMLPLTKAMRLMGVTLEQMDHYLQARHIVRDRLNTRLQAINPNLAGTPEFDRLAGMTDQQAQVILNQYARLEPLARKVDAMVNKTRDLMVTYGLEKQSTIDAWRAAYGAYVPLRREGFEDEGYPSGTGRSVRGSTVKQRLGSGLEATNILANVAQARDQIITRGEKMRPVVAMAGLLMMHPNSDLATLDKPAQIKVTDPITGVVTTVPGNLTNYQVPMVRRVDPRTGLVGLFPDPTYKGRDNVVNFRVNGEDFAIVFNERNPRAMEVAKAFKDTDTAQLTGLMAMIAPYTRYLASINTQYNPIFGIVNFVRDSQFAMLALQTTPLKDKKAEVMSNTIASLRGIYQDARAIRNGQHPTSATAQMWERFQHVGGPTGYRDLFFSSTERAEEIAHLINPMTFSEIRSAKDFGRRMESTWAMQVLSDYNLTMENSIRLGVFTTAVNMGLSDLQAASYAKNITVNFNKRGQIGAQMGSLYAFFNANVQGTARIFETLFERTPNGVAISAAGKKVITGGLLLGVLQTFALAMAGFGDDQPPEYIKARNIIIPMPGTEKGYISIPMPLGFNLLPNVGRAAAETVRRGIEGKPLKLMSQMSDLIGSFYGTFSPLGGSGGIVQELMPTTVDPIVSAFATNKDWTGKSIAKEDVSRLDPTPGHTRARDTATVWATALSRAINWASGGTEHSAGVLSPTPDTLDYLIQQATGGVGREISKSAQVIQSQMTGEELPFYKIPLLGRFGGSATGATAVRDDFYTRVKDVNIASREFEGRVKDKDPSAREYIRENPEARLKPAADQIERKITDLQKLKREELKRGVASERIQQREKQITNLMLRFNQLVDRVRAGQSASE